MDYFQTERLLRTLNFQKFDSIEIDSCLAMAIVVAEGNGWAICLLSLYSRQAIFCLSFLFSLLKEKMLNDDSIFLMKIQYLNRRQRTFLQA